jgi:hypothetical protein
MPIPTLAHEAAAEVIVQFPAGDAAPPVPKSRTKAAEAGPAITSTARMPATNNTFFIVLSSSFFS